MGRPKELIHNSDFNLSFDLVDTYLIRGTINGHSFIYNFGCDIYPRFINYAASSGELSLLKKMLDTYTDSLEFKEQLIKLMGLTA